MKNGPIKLAELRREQIVDAAVAVIAEQGIQHLSLSEIEKKVALSRGQLTSYFKTKEDIFLAVFDRFLPMMCRQPDSSDGQHPFTDMDWLEMVRHILEMILRDTPATHPAFDALQHTFLSQMSNRDDFRERLAALYEKWRNHGAEEIERQLQKRPAVRKVSPRALATMVQAIIHGLAVQKAADPKSVDSREMVHLCLDMLGTYLWIAPAASPRKRRPAKIRSARYRTPLIGEGMEYEMK